MTHWIGGMGMVVLTVALSPLLGVGSFQLSTSFEYESPGPEGGKITPRLSSMAKILWLIYLCLTAAQAILLLLCGMSLFDAMTTAFSTMATGGFGNRNSSIASYNAEIQWIIIIFMFLAGFNFNLIYAVLKKKGKEILRNSEAKAYFLIITISVIIVTVSLSLSGKFNFGGALRTGAFHVLSVLTTTGYAVSDQNLFPPLARGIIFITMFIGGCSSSTAGGMKVIRHVILCKQTGNEIKKLLYPKGVFSISLDKREGKKEVVYGAAGFAFAYALLVLTASIVCAFAGADLFSSINMGLLTTGNIGLGFIEGMEKMIRGFPAYAKWTLSFAMIAGRLELWTIFALFARDWRSL